MHLGVLVTSRGRMCACVQGGDIDGDVQCEMDPVCEVALKAEIMDVCGLSVVGWYHSHPAFAPVPSHCDVTTQSNYQVPC